jgi:ligand-binding sensor domain-containing protein
MPYPPLTGCSSGQKVPANCWFAAVAISCAVLSVNVGQAEDAHLASHSIRLSVVDGNDIRFHHLSTAEGLSQTRVAQIVQDDRGFMWFGTQYGLNRFDGYEFRLFAHDPQFRDSLSGVYISALFKDHAGTIWVGCDPFLERFNANTETFTHYALDTQNRDTSRVAINNIGEDTDGMLWLSTSKGLMMLDPSNGRIVRYRHDSHDLSTIGSNEVKTTGQDRSGQF